MWRIRPVNSIDYNSTVGLINMAYQALRIFLSPIKTPQSLLTGAAKIFSQIRLREVKGLKDRTSYLCTLRD
ncbi:hypothetical protein DMI60_02560 [Escherichia coli]|nr:hypothetical protein [Escherichia coli]NYY75700.1 hypothetical protein [Escherichia coli]